MPASTAPRARPIRAAPHATATPVGGPLARAWPWLRRVLTFVFFTLVAVLLVRQARGIDWAEVLQAMRDSSPAVIAAATALAAASHALYSSFDLFGRRLTGHRLHALRVMGTTFVSYIFNLNFGSLVGGVAFRYRLYARQGLPARQVTTIVATSMSTNWLGYLLVAGMVLAGWPPALPPAWTLADGPLRAAGAAMAALALAWLPLCAFARRRTWTLRGHALTLPGVRMAALQLLASSANWMLMAGVVWLLLGQRIDYAWVLGTLLVGAVAGVLTHVPAGLGVLEAVFIALLGDRLPQGELLAAVLLYRVIYYLGPLTAATLLFWVLDSRLPRRRTATGSAEPVRT